MAGAAVGPAFPENFMGTPLRPAAASDAEIPSGRNRLEGKVILVFGAEASARVGENGKATAVAYAREAATVIAVDREPKAAEETRAIIAELGGRCSTFTANVVDSTK